jgi:malonyl-CoA/methylmalonyl-CoA synthetase
VELDLLEDRSLPGRWTRRWRERSSWPQLQDLDGSWIGSAELEQRTSAAASGLLAAGLVPGDRFLLSAGTSAELVIAYIAALRAGLVVVPLNPAYTRTEVIRIVRHSRPAAAAVDDSVRATWIREGSPRPIRVVGVALDGLPQPSGSEAEIDRAGSDDPALLVYTSGTTGRPKGASLTHGNLLSSATAVNLAWRWEPDDRLLLTLPLFHVHGLGVGINGSLCAGAAIVLRARFDADDVAARCADGASLFFGVPTMYQRLAASGRAAALGSLRLLVSGSAALPATLANEIARDAGQMPLERYGMTETIMLTSNPYDGPRKPGTVGLPLPGVELRLVESGEVEVRGPNVIGGYHEQPEANAEVFTEDGWFSTGDLGELDGDGYLRLVGRSKELIITGGYNVYPREVEEALGTHPAVREVAVVGRASETWGEEVTAVVVADQPVGSEELRAHAARQLAPYKVPKRIEFAAELPRNALGKIVRGELR